MCIHLHVNLCVWNWYRCSLILKLHYIIGCTNDDFNDSENNSESDDDHGDCDKDDNNSENYNNLMMMIMT